MAVIYGGDDAFDTLVSPHQHSAANAVNLQWLQNNLNQVNQAQFVGEAQTFMGQCQTIFLQNTSNEAVLRANAALNQANMHLTANVFSYIPLLGDLPGANTKTQKYLMSEPTIRTVYINGCCAGYSETYVDHDPGKIAEEDFIYRRVLQGVVINPSGYYMPYEPLAPVLPPDPVQDRMIEKFMECALSRYKPTGYHYEPLIWPRLSGRIWVHEKPAPTPKVMETYVEQDRRGNVTEKLVVRSIIEHDEPLEPKSAFFNGSGYSLPAKPDMEYLDLYRLYFLMRKKKPMDYEMNAEDWRQAGINMYAFTRADTEQQMFEYIEETRDVVNKWLKSKELPTVNVYGYPEVSPASNEPIVMAPVYEELEEDVYIETGTCIKTNFGATIIDYDHGFEEPVPVQPDRFESYSDVVREMQVLPDKPDTVGYYVHPDYVEQVKKEVSGAIVEDDDGGFVCRTYIEDLDHPNLDEEFQMELTTTDKLIVLDNWEMMRTATLLKKADPTDIYGGWLS